MTTALSAYSPDRVDAVVASLALSPTCAVAHLADGVAIADSREPRPTRSPSGRRLTSRGLHRRCL